MRLVNPNDMGPKTLVRGLQDLSKMSKNMFIASKLSKICLGEVGKYLGILKSQLCTKGFKNANGPQFFHESLPKGYARPIDLKGSYFLIFD